MIPAWCLYPLEDFPTQGILLPRIGKPVVAEFITVGQARATAKRKAKAA